MATIKIKKKKKKVLENGKIKKTKEMRGLADFSIAQAGTLLSSSGQRPT